MDSKKDLNKALKNLRSYQPPDSVWENINSKLEQDAAETEFRASLKKLPTYVPSDKVWEQIESNLPTRKPVMKVYRTALSIAASVAVVVGFFVWFSNMQSSENLAFAYSEEVLDERLQIEDFPEDAEAFSMIEKICFEKEFLCKHVDFQRLRDEFADLNSAYEELEYAMSDYNTSPELMAELTNIDMERTVVFKQLLAML